MKKTLLAAALVTGFAGVAHAESSVTLYGLVDVGYGYTQTKASGDGWSKKNTQVGARNNVKNGSRWGMKGTEDLGNGTSAIFQLEGGFLPGNGEHAQGGKLFGRQAFVGLSGESWGTFTIGRQYNAADAFVAPIDPFGTGWGQAGALTTFSDALSTRYDNAIKYVSPNYDGFQFGVGLVNQYEKNKTTVGAASTSRTDTLRGITLGAGYNNGPLSIGASYDQLTTKTKITDEETDRVSIKAWNLGAAYDFDVVKVHAIVGQESDGVIGGLGLIGNLVDFDGTNLTTGVNAKGLRRTSWLAGLSAPVGDAGKVLFSYQGNRVTNSKVAEFKDVKFKANVWSLGYSHNLSKRTALYGVVSYGQGKAKAKDVSAVKVKSTDVALGLQHRF